MTYLSIILRSPFVFEFDLKLGPSKGIRNIINCTIQCSVLFSLIFNSCFLFDNFFDAYSFPVVYFWSAASWLNKYRPQRTAHFKMTPQVSHFFFITLFQNVFARKENWYGYAVDLTNQKCDYRPGLKLKEIQMLRQRLCEIGVICKQTTEIVWGQKDISQYYHDDSLESKWLPGNVLNINGPDHNR